MAEGLPQIPGLEVLALISSGGMGDVLLAKRTGAHGFEKLVAVKTIRPELAKRPEIRAMFLDEARLVARLAHPAITHVHDFGEEGDLLYLTMEYVPGVSFGQLRDKAAGPSDPFMAAQLLAEALRGLHAAHELQDSDGRLLEAVHRDVSPDNLILTFDGKVKILDFGIALIRDRETPVTELGSLKGKPAYMAPERLRGDPVDRRTDIFSAGIVLYELLTGEKLFSRGSVIATAMAVENDVVVPPSQKIGRRLPEGLDAIVLKALAKSPSARYAHAKDMAIDLTDLARSHGALPLEAFVETHLLEERAAHRTQLALILDGHRPEVRRTPISEPPPPPPQPMRPLADSTTLVPPQAETVSLKRSWGALPWLLLLLVLLPLAAVPYLMRTSEPEFAPITTPLEDPSLGAEPALEDLDEEEEELGLAVDADETQTATPTEVAKSPRRRTRRPKGSVRKPAETVRTRVEPTTFGYVTVGATPFALVRIDGQEVGPTPILNRKVGAGKHVIEFLRPDTGELRARRVVRVAEDEHERVTVEE
jgi:serine/threonine-protein kinase